MCLDLSRLPLLNVFCLPVSCQLFSKRFKVSLFSSFFIKWVGWYKMWELIIYLNAINFLGELKIKRSYRFLICLLDQNGCLIAIKSRKINSKILEIKS